jgi:hypothetical protein
MCGPSRCCSRAPPKPSASSSGTSLFPLRAGPNLTQALAGVGIEGRPLDPLELRGLAEFIDSVERSRAGIMAATGSLPPPRGHRRPARELQDRDCRRARRHRRLGRGARCGEPRPARHSRPPARPPPAAAPEPRAVRARQGHRASTCRTRSSPNGTAASCCSSAPNIAATSRASSTAVRPAARACFSSPPPPSRSTTTSSNSRSGSARRSSASCWR